MIDLCIPDTKDAKFGLALSLAHRLDLLPPVYIISHKRHGDMPTLRNMPLLKEHASVVVTQPEAADYRAALPGTQVLEIPAGYGGHEYGIGRAKQFCLETADLLGQDHIIILDDDLVLLGIQYPNPQDVTKVSRAFMHSHADVREDFFIGLLVLFALVSEEAYEAHPEAVTSSPQGNNADRTLRAARKRWELNRGGNPSQMQSWRVDRFWERVPGGFDLEKFNYHGEDVSIALAIIESGGAIVNVPGIVAGYLDYETQSVMRTPETAPALRQAEHDGLMSLMLADYVKTREDIIGRPQWHSLRWLALEADGLIKHDQALWDTPMGDDSVI